MIKGFWGCLLLVWAQLAWAQAASVGFIDARQQGSFNIGAAQASISRMYVEESIHRDLLQVNFSLPDQTAAGVWAKEFPASVNKAQTDVLVLQINLPDAPSSEIKTLIEIKGSTGTVRIPVSIQPGWNQVQELLDWNKIGELNEIVFLIQRAGGDNPAVGQLWFDLTFQSLPWLQSLQVTYWGKLLAVVVASLLFAATFTRVRSTKPIAAKGFTRDLFQGVSLAVLVACVFATYTLGTSSPLETGGHYLLIMGAALFALLLLKITFVGNALSATESFRAALFPGLLAAAASREPVWSAPDSFVGFFQLSGFGAALFLALFFLGNLYRLTYHKKSLSFTQGALIVATPMVFGLLLALQTYHHLALQVLLLFAVGEFIANAASLLNRAQLLRSLNLHGTLLILAFMAAVAPDIAALGAGTTAASLPVYLRPIAAVLATMLSQAPLWAIVYVLTGLVLGAIRGNQPSIGGTREDAIRGMKKGLVFGGVLMGLLQISHGFTQATWIQTIYQVSPLLFFVLAGMALFPLLKTIIETFDGSQSFFGRAARAYQDPVLLLRGVVLGVAVAFCVGAGFPELDTATRIGFGALAGAIVFAGVSMVRDGLLGWRGLGAMQSWRSYTVESGLGMFIGAGLGFYFDAAQLPIILMKFELYNSFGLDPMEIVRRCHQVRTTAPNEFTALISRWGQIQLASASGGSAILYNEALMGVIGWGIAAPLFAINKAFLIAALDRDATPIRRLSTHAGITELADGTIYVLRWGLWMAPLIFSFLRPMAEATWYNQDGLIRTGFAVVNSLSHDANGFTAWSLTVFSWIIGYAWFQVLIWVDHMGLRIATLVNLSFIGVDRLDERLAKFVGKDAAARFIPEGVKRFTTWAPLLIPFYLPAGKQWEEVFSKGTAIQAQQAAGSTALTSLWIAALIGATVATLWFTWQRKRLETQETPSQSSNTLVNNVYSVEVKHSGEIYSSLHENEIGISRCSFEKVDPSGRMLFVVELDKKGKLKSTWPVLGNYPQQRFNASNIRSESDRIEIQNTTNEVRTQITISLPSQNDASELWQVQLEDLSGKHRTLMVVPYLEWILNRPEADRNHTQYNRLYPEVGYDTDYNMVLAYHRSTRLYGWLASNKPAKGFLRTRVDFIGRAGSVWTPRALETLHFQAALNCTPIPMFDPIAALLLETPVEANSQTSCRIQIGCQASLVDAQASVRKYLQPQIDNSLHGQPLPPRTPLIGHGEIPDGVPDQYTQYSEDGNTLAVLTPYTPRPFDHEMANSLGHVLSVTNHGLHCSTHGNSQQNRLTPDRSDLTGNQVPSEAIYIYDEESKEWFSPCYDPLKDPSASYHVSFSLDGSAVFAMKKGTLATELTVHVPIDEPAGVYLLKIRNTGKKPRRLRVAPYFQIVLAHSPEHAGILQTPASADPSILFYRNPRNRFHSCTCFVAVSEPAEQHALLRGRFFGAGRSFDRPLMVETGVPGPATEDDFAVAALLTTVEIPAQGEHVLSIVLGAADHRVDAEACARRLRTVETAEKSLQRTRDWWMALQTTLSIETNDPEFSTYVKWMKFQTLSERIWARKGFYQASGAFGFRDQLQDTVNMIWVDPTLARAQLLRNTAQQFLEGDVAHWYFLQQNGQTGLLNRSHASDNLLWLGWGVGEYVRMTGDKRILDEAVHYLNAETPLPPLPAARHGLSFYPLRSPRSESVYQHVMRAIDLVLEKRLGRHGLPLMGTGDWNDGLDEIGSKGKGESVWMAFFLVYILKSWLAIIEERSGSERKDVYERAIEKLEKNIDKVWRNDRYLAAIHDDGTEIGVSGGGYWEASALGAAWAIFAGIHPQRARIALDTALDVLEQDKVIRLGYPPLNNETKPCIGRIGTYPEGVRENGMYSHGVQWLTRACRILSERLAQQGDDEGAQYYRNTAVRLWYKISAIPHARTGEIENYGGQPNQQCADYLTLHDPGRMIWSGYTGAAGWMLRQACEAVVGAQLINNQVQLPEDINTPRGDLNVLGIQRDLSASPLSKQTEDK